MLEVKMTNFELLTLTLTLMSWPRSSIFVFWYANVGLSIPSTKFGKILIRNVDVKPGTDRWMDEQTDKLTHGNNHSIQRDQAMAVDKNDVRLIAQGRVIAPVVYGSMCPIHDHGLDPCIQSTIHMDHPYGSWDWIHGSNPLIHMDHPYGSNGLDHVSHLLDHGLDTWIHIPPVLYPRWDIGLIGQVGIIAHHYP